MSQTRAATFFHWMGLILSAFRSPLALRRRNFAMTPGSMSTRWSRRSRATAGDPTALPECCRLEKPSARAGMFSPLRSRAASPVTTRRVRGKAELRGVRTSAASASWIRSRRGQETICFAGKAATSCAARRGASFDEVYRVVEELHGTRTCSFPWVDAQSRAERAHQQARGDGGGCAWHPRRWTGECGGNARDARRRRGERKTQEFLLQEMERLGYKGGARAHRALRERRVFAGAVYGARRRFPMPMCGGIRLGACVPTMPSAAAS